MRGTSIRAIVAVVAFVVVAGASGVAEAVDTTGCTYWQAIDVVDKVDEKGNEVSGHTEYVFICPVGGTDAYVLILGGAKPRGYWM